MNKTHEHSSEYNLPSPIISAAESAVANTILVQLVAAPFVAAFDIIFTRPRLPFGKALASYIRDPVTWATAAGIGILQGLSTYSATKKSNQAHHQLESRNEALELALSMTGSSLHEAPQQQAVGRPGVSQVDRLLASTATGPDVGIQ